MSNREIIIAVVIAYISDIAFVHVISCFDGSAE
jgi:hypothetical protein